MAAIDHVIFLVDDLDAAAHALFAEHGLASLPGGRHPGHGTGNRIVPLGTDYLELMAVIDPAEAATSQMGMWATSNARDTLSPAAVCVRVDDIAPISTALGEEPLSMSRRTPDGGELSWHLAGLTGMIERGHPFFIQWHGQSHPGGAPADHTVQAGRISAVTIGRVPDTLHALVAAVDGITIGDGAGVSHVTISTGEGSIEFG